MLKWDDWKPWGFIPNEMGFASRSCLFVLTGMHIQFDHSFPALRKFKGQGPRFQTVFTQLQLEGHPKKLAPQLGMKEESETTDQRILNKASSASNAF